MKFLRYSILGLIVLQTVAGGEVYNSDFANKGITGRNVNGLRELVDVDDLPGVSKAMRMTTISKDKKNLAPAWYSSTFKITEQGTVTVDYYVKQLSSTGFYGVYVSSGRKPLVSLIFRGGRILYKTQKQWKSAGTYKLKKWYHVRYIINTECKTYDLYIDDMGFAAAKNIAYRDTSAGLPTRVWLPGATLKNAESEYAEIKVQYKKVEKFPSVQLSRPPFYLIGIGRDKAQIELRNLENMPVAEKGTIVLDSNEKGLILHFEGEGKFGKDYIKKRKPWQNDCIEIFIDPEKTRKRYFHFVVDSFGQRYQALCSAPKNKIRWEGKWESNVIQTESGWGCEIFIPFSTLGAKLKPGSVWGFNVARENSRTNRLNSWVLLNNFHQVERFGNLILSDKNAGTEYESKIAKKIYDISEIEQQIKNISSKLSKLSLPEIAKKEFLELRKKDTAIINNYNQQKHFYGVYERFLALNGLLRDYKEFFSIQKRCAELFKPGSADSQKGFVILPELSMRKIKQFNYVPDNLKKIKLNLAENEYGSFQLAIMADSMNSINKLDVSFTDLNGENNSEIKADNIKSYLVEFIRTALPGKEQVEIADVLIPGNTFTLKKARKTSGIWFDIYVPPKTAPGTYKGKITVSVNDKEPETINYQVEVYPFSLPEKISLKNIFCFVPKWAEQFYGTKMPIEKRKIYFDFLLKHRLNPVNLWSRKALLNEQELKYTIAKGNTVITLRSSVSPEYIKMLKRNNYLDMAMFFAGDEVQGCPHKIPALKREFAQLKQKYPEIPRLCTAWIDPRLYGSIDIWCPRFQQKHFFKKLESGRRKKGEKIWWYFTGGPGAPYANLNLNSPEIDPRIIPWLTWKVGADGLLYWAVNREWKTNGEELRRINEKVLKLRDLSEVRKKFDAGLRWPEIPWLPFSINLYSKRASETNGAGNLMYPGPDWLPYPSIRLKNLRDGIQDYEYLTILKNILNDNNLSGALRREIEKTIKIDKKVVASTTDYTKNPQDILEEKKKIAALIIKAQKVLKIK